MRSEKQLAFLRAQKRQKRIRRGIVCVLLAFTLMVTINDRFLFCEALSWPAIYRISGLRDQPDSDWPCTVRMLNVGSADCTLIQCEGISILIDTGTTYQADMRAADLVRLGASPLDALILSHLHDDHIGGTEAVLRALSPQEVLVGNRSDETDEYLRGFLKIVSRSDAIVKPLFSGQTWTYGSLSIEVLYDGNSGSTENNRSVVLRCCYGGVRMLLMGDAEAEVEQALLKTNMDLTADWIKIGHHGSSTSTSADFLDAVSPKYAFISCGLDNPPDETVLQLLHDRAIEYGRTDIDGTLLFATDGRNCVMFTENS